MRFRYCLYDWDTKFAWAWKTGTRRHAVKVPDCRVVPPKQPPSEIPQAHVRRHAIIKAAHLYQAIKEYRK